MKQQRVPIEQFTMPYGKYKGIKLGDLYYKDKEYLEWCKSKFDPKETVGSRIREFMDKMNGMEKQINEPEMELEF